MAKKHEVRGPMPSSNPPVIESTPADIELAELEEDRSRMRKYFRELEQIPSLNSAKAKRYTGEFLEDLRVFRVKWENIFGV